MKKWTVFFSLLASLCLGITLFHFSTDTVIEKAEFSSVAKASQVLKYRGPIDDCMLSDTLYNRSYQINATCTENYVHFFPTETLKNKKNEKRSPKELKVGSFNLFHLGDNQAPMKSYAIVASIINQWDLVGGQEMMPLASDIANENRKLGDAIQATPSLSFPFEDWSVLAPGYLRVLRELQKLDTSWALILQPTSEGEGGAGEMAGFYYRSTVVQLKEWDYCSFEKAFDTKSGTQAGNLACLTQASEAVAKLTSRLAFAAFFKSENFDFIALTTHNRFRRSLDPKDLETQKKLICNNHSQPSQCKIPLDHVGRYYEIQAVAEQIGKMKEDAKDADVIFMGDFNIELDPITVENWKASLRAAPLLRPFQKEPTTVGIKFSKMVNSYDHFILDTKWTSECNAEAAKSYDFVKAAARNTSTADKLIKRHMSVSAQTAVAAEKKKETEKFIKVQNSSSGPIVRVLNEKEKDEINASYDAALIRMKVNDYAVVLELISDHIPIEMICKKDLADDD